MMPPHFGTCPTRWQHDFGGWPTGTYLGFRLGGGGVHWKGFFFPLFACVLLGGGGARCLLLQQPGERGPNTLRDIPESLA